MPNDNGAIFRAGLRGRCPECLEGPLFDGFLKFGRICPSCGYDYQQNDIADGPAVFVMFAASLLVVPPALAFQILLDPPIWLTLLIFIPLIILVSLVLLRPFRGAMFAAQVMNNAAEAQWAPSLDAQDTQPDSSGEHD